MIRRAIRAIRIRMRAKRVKGYTGWTRAELDAILGRAE